MTLSRLLRPVAAAAVLLLWLLVPSAARAGKDGPGTAAVRGANQAINALLAREVKAGSKEEQELAAQVTASVRGFLDVDVLGERALTDHWAGLSATQRAEYLGLLRGLIEDNYVKGLRANLQYEITYKGEAARKDGSLLVKTEIKTSRRGRPLKIKVDYVLRKDGKAWRCFDVVTDGVGLVENYRAQFNKIVGKDGFDGLLAKMKKKRGA
jgi:phospholipid transport system substrate-binding protein